MSLIGSIVQEIVGQVAGEGAGALAEGPLARLTRALRRRVSLPAVVFVWTLALIAMIFGWRLGLRTTSAMGQAFAIVLWFGGPVSALVVTDLWWHRRDV